MLVNRGSRNSCASVMQIVRTGRLAPSGLIPCLILAPDARKYGHAQATRQDRLKRQRRFKEVINYTRYAQRVADREAKQNDLQEGLGWWLEWSPCPIRHNQKPVSCVRCTAADYEFRLGDGICHGCWMRKRNLHIDVPLPF